MMDSTSWVFVLFFIFGDSPPSYASSTATIPADCGDRTSFHFFQWGTTADNGRTSRLDTTYLTSGFEDESIKQFGGFFFLSLPDGKSLSSRRDDEFGYNQ